MKLYYNSTEAWNLLGNSQHRLIENLTRPGFSRCSFYLFDDLCVHDCCVHLGEILFPLECVCVCTHVY